VFTSTRALTRTPRAIAAIVLLCAVGTLPACHVDDGRNGSIVAPDPIDTQCPPPDRSAGSGAATGWVRAQDPRPCTLF
jgi:hypothetical protein